MQECGTLFFKFLQKETKTCRIYPSIIVAVCALQMTIKRASFSPIILNRLQVPIEFIYSNCHAFKVHLAQELMFHCVTIYVHLPSQQKGLHVYLTPRCVQMVQPVLPVPWVVRLRACARYLCARGGTYSPYTLAC